MPTAPQIRHANDWEDIIDFLQLKRIPPLLRRHLPTSTHRGQKSHLESLLAPHQSLGSVLDSLHKRLDVRLVLRLLQSGGYRRQEEVVDACCCTVCHARRAK